MAAPHSVDPAQLAEQLASASPDVLREMVTTMANALMSAQADQLCGAEYGERSPQRSNRRNGYRTRDWDTRAGPGERAGAQRRPGAEIPDGVVTPRPRPPPPQPSRPWSPSSRPPTCSGSPRGGWRSSPSNSGSSPCRARRSARWPPTSTPRSPHSATGRWTPARTRSAGSTRSRSRCARTGGWSTCTP